MREVERVILHLDMDAFYAAIEAREDPTLAGRPLIIGHPGARGVVATCSYEARRYGVRSAMPSVLAERRCPQAIWRPARMDLYAEVSRSILRILRDYSPVIEPLSIDEAFIDLTGIAADLAQGRARGAEIKQRIRREQDLGASVGIARNKFLAKLASDLEKPDGLCVLTDEALPQRLRPLPVERLWGVGPRLGQRLRGRGLRTIGDLLAVAEDELFALVGPATASHLRSLARGEDPRRVEPERESKSISEERTYAEDLTDPEAIDRALLARAEGVARQLRLARCVARTVRIKVRIADYTTWTRAHTLVEATDLTEPIVRAARDLLAERVPLGGRGVRLLGLGVSGLLPAGTAQRALFSTTDEQRARRLARASDAVRDRLGERALTRARLLRRREAEGQDAADDPPDPTGAD